MTLFRLTHRLAATAGLALALVALSSAGCSSDAEAASEQAPAPGLIELEPFLTNISDPSTERYCKLSVKLAVVPQKEANRIGDDPLLIARLRDHVLTSLTAKTFLELSEPDGKESFRSELRKGLNEILKSGEVSEVLFSEFVVQ